MRNRTVRLLLVVLAAVVVLGMLAPGSRLTLGHSEIHVTGPDGEYHLKSSGNGPQDVTLELPDGAYAKASVR